MLVLHILQFNTKCFIILYELYDQHNNLSEKMNKNTWKWQLHTNCLNATSLCKTWLSYILQQNLKMVQITFCSSLECLICCFVLFCFYIFTFLHFTFGSSVCLHMFVSERLKGFHHVLDWFIWFPASQWHVSFSPHQFDSQYHNNIDQKRPAATLPLCTSLSPSFFLSLQ